MTSERIEKRLANILFALIPIFLILVLFLVGLLIAAAVLRSIVWMWA